MPDPSPLGRKERQAEKYTTSDDSITTQRCTDATLLQRKSEWTDEAAATLLLHPIGMTISAGSSTSLASSIEQLDAVARQLYARARGAGSEFKDVATVTQSLRTILKHLRAEAEDPDSLLNAAPDARQQPPPERAHKMSTCGS